MCTMPSSAAIALGAALGLTVLPAFAEDNLPSQPNPAVEKADNLGAAGLDNRKTSATNDQSGPSSTTSNAMEPRSQVDQATHTVSGRAGKQEPGSHAPSQDAAVFVDGKLNVPGAPTDSQTVPAKFSARNDRIDKTPIMAMSLGLTDEQKKKIAESVGRAGAPTLQTSAKPAEELPWGVAIHDLPNVATDPLLPKVKYVRTSDRILLVWPDNRVVAEEIEN
jgi:hypothetical protein